jgi:hypothetical protein
MQYARVADWRPVPMLHGSRPEIDVKMLPKFKALTQILDFAALR